MSVAVKPLNTVPSPTLDLLSAVTVNGAEVTVTLPLAGLPRLSV